MSENIVINDDQFIDQNILEFIKDEIICQLCWDQITDPKMCKNCQNNLCEKHISELEKCPLCGENPFNTLKNKQLSDQLEKIQLKCINSSEGCMAKLNLINIYDHQLNCKKCEDCNYVGAQHSLEACYKRKFELVFNQVINILDDINKYSAEIEKFKSSTNKMNVIKQFDKNNPIISESNNNIIIQNNNFNLNKLINKQYGHENYINSILIDGNGYFYSCSQDTTIRKIRINNGLCEQIFKNNCPIICSALSNDGQIQYGDSNGYISKLKNDYLTFVKKISQIKSPKGDHKKFLSMVIYSDNLFCGNNYEEIQKFNYELELLQIFEGQKGKVDNLIIDNKGFIQSFSSKSNIVRKWKCSDGECMFEIKFPSEVYSLAIDNFDYLIIGGNRGIVKYDSISGSQKQMRIFGEHIMSINVINIHFIIIAYKYKLSIIDSQSQNIKKTIEHDILIPKYSLYHNGKFQLAGSSKDISIFE